MGGRVECWYRMLRRFEERRADKLACFTSTRDIWTGRNSFASVRQHAPVTSVASIPGLRRGQLVPGRDQGREDCLHLLHRRHPVLVPSGELANLMPGNRGTILCHAV